MVCRCSKPRFKSSFYTVIEIKKHVLAMLQKLSQLLAVDWLMVKTFEWTTEGHEAVKNRNPILYPVWKTAALGVADRPSLFEWQKKESPVVD